MADLDHIKRINDPFGHQAGDEVLKAAARTLRASLRASDLATHYGGEEFVLAGSCHNESEVKEIAERLLAAVRGLEVDVPGQILRGTVSLGVVPAHPCRNCPPWVILQAADQALYRAKAAGRDRCEIEPRTPGSIGRLGSRAAPCEPGLRRGYPSVRTGSSSAWSDSRAGAACSGLGMVAPSTVIPARDSGSGLAEEVGEGLPMLEELGRDLGSGKPIGQSGEGTGDVVRA